MFHRVPAGTALVLRCARPRASGWRVTTGLVALLVAAGCAPDATPPPLVEIGEAGRPDFRHDADLSGDYAYPEIIGSGGAVFDADDDGDLDLFLVGGAADDRLFLREADGSYRDGSAAAGLAPHDGTPGMGAAVGDVDNDGDLDLLVTRVGRDRLYRNEGGGRFRDVTGESGLDAELWSTSAVFCDVDDDGWLDLYVATYVRPEPRQCRDGNGHREYCAPAEYRGVPDLLYRNVDGIRFEEVRSQAGIAGVNRGLGVVCADLNRDGDVDLFVANDGEANRLWINLGEGRFEDRSVLSGVAVNLFGEPEASMGVALGDVDGDLGLDLVLTHLDRETDTLYRHVADGAFQDATPASGLAAESLRRTGFGVELVDLDRDGDLDLAVANGGVTRGDGAAPPMSADGSRDGNDRAFLDGYGQRDTLLANDGEGRFVPFPASSPAFDDRPAVGRGLLADDLDGDGAPDLVVTHANGPVRLFLNRWPEAGHGLRVEAIDTRWGREAVGARVELESGGRRQVRWIGHTRSYLMSGEAAARFGLGDATRYDALDVVWTDGRRERFPGGPAGGTVQVRRGDGQWLE